MHNHIMAYSLKSLNCMFQKHLYLNIKKNPFYNHEQHKCMNIFIYILEYVATSWRSYQNLLENRT